MNDGTDLPEAARIGRVGLRVGDLDRAVDFYTDVVGLSMIDDRRDEGRVPEAVLGAGVEPLLVLQDGSDAPERSDREAGLFHVAFRVPTRAALGAALRRLEDRWRLTGASDHLVSEAIYARDPAGNGVEIYHDTPRDEWTAREDGGVVIDSLPLDLEALRVAVTPSDGERGRSADVTDRLPPESDVGHVHLEVTELDRSVAFYAEAVGLAVRDGTHDGAAFLAAGDYHHHLGLNVWRRRTEPASGGRGLAWYELVVPESDLGGVRDRLADAGVRITSVDPSEPTEPRKGPVSTEHGPFETSDPDGIRVRFSPERRTTTERQVAERSERQVAERSERQGADGKAERSETDEGVADR